MTDIICNSFDDLKSKISGLCVDGTSDLSLKLCGIELTNDSGRVEIADTALRFYKKSGFYNLEFVGLEKTTSSFNELQEVLSDNSFNSEQKWESAYPAVEILETKLDTHPHGNLKLQINKHELLALNFYNYSSDVCLNNYIEDIVKIITIILCKYGSKNKYKTVLAEHILKIITDNKLEIYEETDCKYEDGFWNIALSSNCGFTYFYDKPKKNHYLNLRGFYLGNNSADFKEKIKNIFGVDDVYIEPLTRLGSDVAEEVCFEFKDKHGKFINSNLNNFKINFKNTDFFAIVFKNEQEVIDNSKIKQFIEYLLNSQKIKLGILENSPIIQSVGFAIGLINEFAFPVKIVQEQIKSILMSCGHQEDNIQLLDNRTTADSLKINIIANVSSSEDIKLIKAQFGNRVIFIACGLEHDLASVSIQKIVKEFKTRIQINTDNPNESDYRKIGENLTDNPELKKLRAGLNKCYHQADFFLTYESDKDTKLSKHKVKQQLKRFFNLLHGFPFATPTKDEYAMYMAFSSALRSADLSRQVGAVITTTNGDILATGANDIPKSGGGLYRAHLNEQNGSIYDDALGRDYMRGFDSNVIEKNLLIDNIYAALENYVDATKIDDIKLAIANSKLKDITEYGRVVHAEMEALMACARGHVSSDGAILYCTTFPCHNCAKHIITAGIKRVVYIEPYAKSKALPFHFDSVVDEESNPIEELIKDKLKNEMLKEQSKKVSFESFVGVGPNLFRQLFKMRDDSRKDKNGLIKTWTPQLIDL